MRELWRRALPRPAAVSAHGEAEPDAGPRLGARAGARELLATTGRTRSTRGSRTSWTASSRRSERGPMPVAPAPPDERHDGALSPRWAPAAPGAPRRPRRADPRRGVRAPAGARRAGPGRRGRGLLAGGRCATCATAWRGSRSGSSGARWRPSPEPSPSSTAPGDPAVRYGAGAVHFDPGPPACTSSTRTPSSTGRRARPTSSASCRWPRCCRLRRAVDRRRLRGRARGDRRPLPPLPRAALLGQAGRHRLVQRPDDAGHDRPAGDRRRRS